MRGKNLKRLVLSLVFLWTHSAHLHAAFPQREVRLIVPFPAGGSTDVLTRLVSARLSEMWRHPVIVENIPGNSSVAGTQAVASAAPDGHTLLAVNAALAMNEALSRKLPYHALRSFAPVSLLARQQFVFAVPAGSRITTVGELIETSRTSRVQLNYGSSGLGSLGHLAGELLKLMTGARFTYVPHKGARHALDELAARHVAYVIVPLPRALPALKNGRIRAVAVAGTDRATALPDVPTIGASVSGYGISTWNGLLAPYGASVQVVRQINADVQTIIRKDELASLMTSLGYEPNASTPGDFQNRLRADIERYSRIVFDAGMGMP